MKPSPAFQFYPHDFLVGTADLSSEEVGGYIRLLCYQWAKGSLPKDDKKLMQLSGITDPYVMGNVSVKFRLCDDGMLRNERLEKVRTEQEEYRRSQSENGKKGGNPNFQTGKHNPYYNREDNPPHNPKINSSSSASSSTITMKEEEVASLPVTISLNTKKAYKQRSVLTTEWMSAYKAHFGQEYLHGGDKDEVAANRLISMPNFKMEEVIAIAKKAWNNPSGFRSKMAASLSGFVSQFNDIRGENGDLKISKQSLKDDPFWKT